MKTFSASAVALALLASSAGVSLAQQADTAQLSQSNLGGQASSPDRPAIPGALPDSQSYPAKFSAQNDRLDKLPIMAHPIPLSDLQKRRIVEAVKQQNAPLETIGTAPSELLPYGVTPLALPAGLATEIPMLDHLSHIRVPGKILLVMPSNKIVVGEVAAE